MPGQCGQGSGQVGPPLPAGVREAGWVGPGVRNEAGGGGQDATRRRQGVRAGGCQVLTLSGCVLAVFDKP